MCFAFRFLASDFRFFLSLSFAVFFVLYRHFVSFCRQSLEITFSAEVNIMHITRGLIAFFSPATSSTPFPSSISVFKRHREKQDFCCFLLEMHTLLSRYNQDLGGSIKHYYWIVNYGIVAILIQASSPTYIDKILIYMHTSRYG